MGIDETELSFEQALDKLEQIVEKLEKGDAALEEAIELFQEGMKLSQFCSLKLEVVERKIEMLVEEDGVLKKKSFIPESEE